MTISNRHMYRKLQTCWQFLKMLLHFLWLFTVLRFHFQFGFSSVLHRKLRFRFSRFRFLREIWVKQTILTANVITLSENRSNLGLYSLYVESLVNGS